MVLTFKCADEILWCDHLNETSLVVLVVLFVLYIVLNFESVDRIPWCDHSNETSLAVFPQDTVCFSALKKKLVTFGSEWA